MSEEQKIILEVRNVCKSIKGRDILKDISFSLKENEIVGFIGPNGAGKSTIMKCMTGLYKVSEGSILIDGNDIEKHREDALSKVGASIEYPSLYPELTGEEHFKLVASWRKVSKERIKQMEEFSNLKDNLKRKARNYSMGMKQKLMLSLIMLSDPDLLILDEPTNGLDPDAVFDLREKLLDIKKQGKTIFISSHNLDEIQKIVDRVIFIEKGRIIQDKKLEDLQINNGIYHMKVSNGKKAMDVITSMQIEGSHFDDEVKIHMNNDAFPIVLDAFSKHGILIYSIDKEMMNLEAYYKIIYKES